MRSVIRVHSHVEFYEKFRISARLYISGRPLRFIQMAMSRVLLYFPSKNTAQIQTKRQLSLSNLHGLMDRTLVFHLGDPGSIPGLSSPFVPILLVCLFLPFKISRHFKFAADSRVGNQSFGQIVKTVSTNKDIIMANLIYITLEKTRL